MESYKDPRQSYEDPIRSYENPIEISACRERGKGVQDTSILLRIHANGHSLQRYPAAHITTGVPVESLYSFIGGEIVLPWGRIQ